MPSSPWDPHEIVAHQGFVRSLARGLVADPAAADDLAQESLLRVIQRAPERPKRARGWLAHVVANLSRERHRGEQRRLAREQASSFATLAAASAPSTAEIVQRMELHRRLVELVLSLDAPYREVVLLHHFEGLTVTQTAERLGVPLETARTRLRRALATLREKLDVELGGRDAALSALLPLAQWALPHAAVPVAAATTTAVAGSAATLLFGVPIVMTSTLKLSLAAASALVVGGILWWGLGDDVVPPREVATAHDREAPLPDPAPADAAAPSTAPAPVVAERATIDTARSASGEFAPITPDHGSLRLKTVLESDGTAAPHTHIRIVPLDRTMPFPDLRRARTNDRGELLLRDLLPGNLKVAAAGFDGGADAKSCVRNVEVVAGEVVEVSLLLPDKYLVRGEVVDALGKPVPAADIWVSDVSGAFSDGVFAASADSQGRFELTAAGVMHFIAARAPGYAMSAAVYPTFLQFETRSVRLVLSKPGATLTGRILDPEARPIARALVVVEVEEGTSMLLDNGSIQERPPPRIARTDLEGRFELDSLPPGTLLVAARAEGFAVQSFPVTVEAGATIERDLRLEAGATIVGRLTDPEGKPVDAVSIDAWATPGGRLGLLIDTKTTTNEDGEFEIARLPPGHVILNVEAGPRGSVRRPLELPKSGSIRCDLVLACGKPIRGRVVDEHGRPLPNARVDAVPVTSAPRIPPPVIADSDGRFEIQDCGDVDWKLVVYQEANTYLVLATLEPVRPGSDELTLVIGAAQRATACMRARFLDPDGRPVVALVSVMQEGGNAVFSHASRPNGEFETPLYPPGRYSIWASLDGFASLDLGWHRLEQDQTLDLGEQRFSKPASLVVHAVRDDGGPVKPDDVTLRGAGDGGSVELVRAGSELRADRIVPGDYVLEVRGPDVAFQQVPVTCKAGEVVTLDLLLESGVTRRFTIRRGDDLPLDRGSAERSPATLHWTVSDANGHELHGSLAAAPEATTVELELCLAVGDWSLEVTAPDGARGEATFAASRRQRDGDPILVTLDAR